MRGFELDCIPGYRRTRRQLVFAHIWDRASLPLTKFFKAWSFVAPLPKQEKSGLGISASDIPKLNAPLISLQNPSIQTLLLLCIPALRLDSSSSVLTIPFSSSAIAVLDLLDDVRSLLCLPTGER